MTPKFSKGAEKAKFTGLGGGLVRLRSPRGIKPNRLLQCLNLEERYGEQGYGGIFGYERVDGRTAPSAATYWVLAYTGGNAAINPGDTITNGATAVAVVVLNTISSGTVGAGTAAGTLIVTTLTNNWAAADPVQVGGVTKATASAAAEQGTLAVGAANHQTWLTATRSYLRALIQKVPGSGQILGVAVYKTVVYAARNAADGLSAAIYKTTAGGWSLVSGGFIPSGVWRFWVANFSANSTTLALFGVDGKNRLVKWDGAAITRPTTIYGSEALSTSAVTIALGAQSFVHAGTTRSWQVGDDLTVWNQGAAQNWMRGLVTGYNAGTSTVTINVTTKGGAGLLSSWEIGRSDFQDKPFDVAEHKNHLWLSYPLGMLQTSNLGDPLTYTTTASNFGLGQELTGVKSLKGSILGVFCRGKIEFITGSSATDWAKEPYSTSLGALVGTLADNQSNAVFCTTSGVVNLMAVQSTGRFAPSDLMRDFRGYYTSRINAVVGARLVAATNQYRVYFSDKTMLRLSMLSGDSQATADTCSITRQQYNHQATCMAQGTLTDNTEGLFFGTSDGYVMQEDKGTSFDGTAIDYVGLTAFNHFGTPDNNKQFTELDFEVTCDDPLAISFRQLFDYDDGIFPHGGDVVAATTGTGGQFDVSQFDTFLFDLPIHTHAPIPVGGRGSSMALLFSITSDYVRPFLVSGYNTKFSVTGSKRP